MDLDDEEIRVCDNGERRVVVISNNFILASGKNQDITPLGHKILRWAVSGVDSVRDAKFFCFEIKVLELSEKFFISKRNIYRDVKTALRGLGRIQLLVDGGGDYDYIPIFSRLKYRSGSIFLKFNEEMGPFFLGLKRAFTKYSLSDIFLMHSGFSIKIYELVRMKLKSAKVFADKHATVRITLDELRRVTGTCDVMPNLAHWRKKVLSVAVREIESAGYHLEVEPIKRGRTTTGFVFDVWSLAGWRRQRDSKTTSVM